MLLHPMPRQSLASVTRRCRQEMIRGPDLPNFLFGFSEWRLGLNMARSLLQALMRRKLRRLHD